MITINVNGVEHKLDIAEDTPALWAIREQLGLTGTKFGCGVAQCGACTIHVNGTPIRACVTPIGALQNTEITTIEGIGTSDALHPVQEAWIAEQVPQCGYCQSGQIMSAVALLAQNPNPDDAAIDQAMSGNICRCGMYNRIRTAIKSAAGNATQNNVAFYDATTTENNHG